MSSEQRQLLQRLTPRCTIVINSEHILFVTERHLHWALSGIENEVAMRTPPEPLGPGTPMGQASPQRTFPLTAGPESRSSRSFGCSRSLSAHLPPSAPGLSAPTRRAGSVRARLRPVASVCPAQPLWRVAAPESDTPLGQDALRRSLSLAQTRSRGRLALSAIRLSGNSGTSQHGRRSGCWVPLQTADSTLGVILSPGPELRLSAEELHSLPPSVTAVGQTLREIEREHIAHILHSTNGVVGGKHGAASILGMKRTTLQYKMRQLDIHRHMSPAHM